MKKYLLIFPLLVFIFGINVVSAYYQVTIEQNDKSTQSNARSDYNQILGRLYNVFGNMRLDSYTVSMKNDSLPSVAIPQFSEYLLNGTTTTATWWLSETSTCGGQPTATTNYNVALTNSQEDYIFQFYPVPTGLILCKNTEGVGVSIVNSIEIIPNRIYAIRINTQIADTGTPRNSRFYGSSTDTYTEGNTFCNEGACGISDLYFKLEGISIPPLVYGNIFCNPSNITHFNIGQGGNSQRAAQKISFQSDVNVDHFRIRKLFKVGNPSDNLTAVIRQGNYPYDIVTSSTTFVPASQISTSENSDGNDQSFVFSTNNLLSNTPYIFSLERTGSQDASNYYRITTNNNDDGICSYDGHNSFALAYDGTNYSNNLTTDLVFSVNSIFYSQLQGPTTLNLRENYGTTSTLKRVLPQGWVVKVLNTINDTGNNIEANGYRWYKVKDLTDDEEGWMQAIKLSDSTAYLDHDANIQEDLEAKTYQQSTKAARIPVIEEAVEAYMDEDNTGNSLYGVGGTGNDFNEFISDESFPRELFLGIISQETGLYDFNNIQCSSDKLGGLGIMQITTGGFKGKASGYRDEAKAADNTGDCWGSDAAISTYYSNSLQGIWANIKDGFRALQEKHEDTLGRMASQYWVASCPLTIGTTNLSCVDLKKILTTWAYNSFKIYDSTGTPNAYLGGVASKMNGLSTNFSDINSTVATDLRTKLNLANENKHMIKLHSPGDLSVKDSSGNQTGIFDGAQSEDILFSAYDAERKGAVIFFPDQTANAYSYIVQGTDTGTYGLTIDNYDNSETPIPVDIKNVPLKPDVVHKFTVDWEEVESTGGGVHVDVDRDGDGTYDYGFDTTSTMNDSTGPTTTSSYSGTTGTNGWYKSNVTVTLSATDNTGGTGVLETKYSIDNGANWNLYSAPFTISSEGTTTLKYYSSDKIGNIESTITETIKIDKSAPEAKISFDTTNGLPKIEGTDNLSATTITKVDDSNYTITDNSGHTLKINLLAIHTAPILSNPAVLTMKINTLQYDSSSAITLPITAMVYKWLGSPLTLLTQNVSVVLQFVVTGVYNPVNNTTTLVEVQGVGLPTTQTLSGLKLIKLKTQAGGLAWE